MKRVPPPRGAGRVVRPPLSEAAKTGKEAHDRTVCCGAPKSLTSSFSIWPVTLRPTDPTAGCRVSH